MESQVSIYFCRALLDGNSFVETNSSGFAGNTESQGGKTIELIALLHEKNLRICDENY